MSETDYNARLYEKMKAEQDKYRDWLVRQEPSEILEHTYEYTMREDIVMCMEELELEPEKARALLRSPCPLSDVYQEDFTQQGQALLTMLLLHPGKSFSLNEIYDVIAQDKESGNPTSVVNNAIYRLRSNLDIIGLKELVQCARGTYSLSPRFNVESDAARFLRFYQTAKETCDPDKKLELCHSALSLYQNPLPECLSGSVRWILECSNMNAKFLNATMECIDLHLARGEYSLAYEVAHDALDIDPNEPRMMLFMAKAMKLAKRPGLKAYVKKITPFLDEAEQALLKEVLEGSGPVTPS